MLNSAKYYDPAAAIQVIGCALRDLTLLDDGGEYFFTQDDFPNEFHGVLFGVIYNLRKMGTEIVTLKVFEDYLQNREQSYGTYMSNGGPEWVDRSMREADPTNFTYYYNRLKKMTLLRKYTDAGVDVNWLYDPDEIMDIAKKERQNEYLDSLSLEEIANIIDDRILDVREAYVDNSSHIAALLGDTVEDTLERLKETPAVGASLYDPMTNAICMGARQGKFYIRSAATGVGKSRTLMADACHLACKRYFCNTTGFWEETGNHEPTLFISVELDEEELQTMAIAFIAGVDEDKVTGIIDPNFEETKRIVEAISILKDSPLFFEYLPDYGLIDIENSIKRNIRKNKVRYVMMDYITTSMKIISDLTKQARGMALREDQVLFQLSSKLKDIASVYNVFIMSATQLNYSYKTDNIPNESLLAGAKSIANRIDVGMIMLNVTPQEKEEIAPLCESMGVTIPNIKMSIYKNRRGKHTNVLLWMYADKGKCRYDSMFMTDFSNEPLNPPENIKAKMID